MLIQSFTDLLSGDRLLITRSRRNIMVLGMALCLVVVVVMTQSTQVAMVFGDHYTSKPIEVSQPKPLSAPPKTDLDPLRPEPARIDWCEGWDSTKDAQHDPPDCLRARQYRQIQKFKSIAGLEEIYKIDKDVLLAVDHAEKCALGLLTCPQRPIIVTDWMYIRRMEEWEPAGEIVWMGPILDAAREAGYTIARFDGNQGLHHLWRFLSLLSESLHVYWAAEQHTMACMHHPRCIRPKDYTPSPNESLRYDVASIPPDELGTLPPWKIMTLSYWGSRPEPHHGMHMSAKHDYGIAEGEWSWHLFGQKFQITPYAYPNHTQIPITIEKQCLESPVVDFENRDKAVAILAKTSNYFKSLEGKWDAIAQGCQDFGADMWSFASIKNDIPIPTPLVKIGRLSRADYGRKTAHARVLLGIGDPPISPTPYGFLCRGIPAVLPYRGDTPTPEGWDLYDHDKAQHGPANLLGEPYVYTYKMGNVEEMVATLHRAYDKRIERYIPPDMTMEAVYTRTRQVLAHDWEKEYHAVVRANGGKIPSYPATIMEYCVKSKMCRPFTNDVEDNYYFEHEKNKHSQESHT